MVALTDVRVDADDGLVAVVDLARGHEKGAVAAGRHHAVRPADVLVRVVVALGDARVYVVVVQRLEDLLERAIVRVVVLDEAFVRGTALLELEKSEVN